MNQNEQAREYSHFEEATHSVTHGIGALLGITGLCMLLIRVWGRGVPDVMAAVVYGVALIILYTASASYHAASLRYGDYSVSRVRDFFMKCDHTSIYLLILGTYTPAALSMGGAVGLIVFSVVAVCSAIGITINIINVDRFARVSMVLYLVAGWTIALASVPYFKAVGARGFGLLLIGGLLYTVGVVFYKLRSVRYMHILWHLFVLGGSVTHYFMVYFYCF